MAKSAPPWSKNKAAAFLGISIRTLERRIADGTIRATKLARRVLVPDDVIRRAKRQVIISDAEVRRVANGGPKT